MDFSVEKILNELNEVGLRYISVPENVYNGLRVYWYSLGFLKGLHGLRG